MAGGEIHGAGELSDAPGGGGILFDVVAAARHAGIVAGGDGGEGQTWRGRRACLIQPGLRRVG